MISQDRPQRIGAGPAVDAHGLLLTTTPVAAGWYRAAQCDSWDRAACLSALGAAVAADPNFTLAAVDLSVLDGRPIPATTAAQHAWERHHVEVAAAAARGNLRRAVDLLRDHLIAVHCDPVGLAVVLDAGGGELLEDVLAGLAKCHGRRQCGGCRA